MKRSFCALLFCLLTGSVFSQTAAEMLSYLKKNIEIYYLSRPNVPADTLSFTRISPEGVFLDTDGIMLGKKNNNGMDNTALFLSALFKEFRTKNSGDIELQEIIYTIMQSKQKKVKLYFINDIADPITQETAESLGFYFMKSSSTDIHVWPGTFESTGQESSTYAGAIIVGEYRYAMTGLKLQMIRSFSNLYTGNYNYLSARDISKLGNKNPPTGMYTDTVFHLAYVNSDMRTQVNEAIGIGFVSLFSKNEWTETINWFAANPYILVPSPGATSFLVREVEIPKEFLLGFQLQQRKRELSDTGRYLTDPPFPLEREYLRQWKLYNLNALPVGMFIQNQQVLGLLCHEFIEKYFQPTFINCITYGNNRLEKAPPGDKFSIFMENLCLGLLGGKTISTATDKNYLFPLAIADLLMNFPFGNEPARITENDKRTFFGAFRSGSFSTSLIDEYFKERPAIKAAVDRANRRPGMIYRATGETNFTALVNAVWDQLVKK